MSSIQTVVASLFGVTTSRSDGARTGGRRAPACEALEGRQLLNASWGSGLAGSYGVWDATAGGPGSPDPAHVHHGDGPGGLDKNHFHNPGAEGQGHPGKGPGIFALSPQAKADFQTLQNDIKSEIPATLTAQLKADKATIDQALTSLTPAQRKAEHTAFESATATPPSDPTAALSARLKAANVSDAQINQIITDFQTYQSTLQSIDPTLSAKITADQAALAKDLPAGHQPGPMGGPGLMGPGLVGPGLMGPGL
jgi:hypothetical protein